MTAVTARPVKLLYFAWVREKIGRASEEITVPADIVTVGDLMSWLKTQGPEYAEAFHRAEVIRASIDQSHVKPATPIGAAREIAFFPPVTGG